MEWNETNVRSIYYCACGWQGKEERRGGKGKGKYEGECREKEGFFSGEREKGERRKGCSAVGGWEIYRRMVGEREEYTTASKQM